MADLVVGFNDSDGNTSEGSSSKRPKLNKSPNKFKYILLFNDFKNNLNEDKKRNKSDKDKEKDKYIFKLKYDATTDNVVYGITANYTVIVIKKIILIKNKNNYVFLIEDNIGTNSYRMNEINFFQGQKQESPVFNLSSNYKYEIYYNFKGDELTIDENTEYYLIVREKKASNNIFQIIHIFYNFQMPKNKVKSVSFFVGNNNNLQSTDKKTNSLLQTSVPISSAPTISGIPTISNIPRLKLKKPPIEKSFGTVKAIQPFEDLDPYEINGCIQETNGNKDIYKIDQINLDDRYSLLKNFITIKSISNPNDILSPEISELKDKYKHSRCVKEDDTQCQSYKFTDDILTKICSTVKDPYKKHKIESKPLNEILSPKNNKKCPKDAEILRRKCDMLIKQSKAK